MKKLFILFFILCFSGISFLAAQTTIEPFGVSPRAADSSEADIFDKAYSSLLNVGVETQMYLKGSSDKAFSLGTWTVLSRPSGSADLTDNTQMDTSSVVAIFTPDAVGAYEIKFEANSKSDTVTINVGKYVGIKDKGCSAALCHGPKVTSWQETGHSDMLVRGLNGTLSDHYSSGCISCHTTGYDADADNDGFDDFGFVYPDSAIIASYGDTTGHLFVGLYDSLALYNPDAFQRANIQCESCHGPASEHGLGNPDIMNSSLDIKVCAVCHDEGDHHAFPAQWELSGQDASEFDPDRGFHGGHAKGEYMGYAGGRSGCSECHSGSGFVEWVKNGNVSPNPVPTPTLITCATCHDPHDATNEHQLRVVEVELGDGTVVTYDQYGTGVLCMNCHRSRRDALTYASDPDNASSHYGAHHGPEADMFVGTNAPNLGVELPKGGVHAAETENACVDCHMAGEAVVVDGEVVDVGGHTFNMTNAKGVDNVEACANCHASFGESFKEKKAYINGTYDHDGDGTDEGLQEEVHGLLEQLASLLPPKGVGEVDVNDTTLAPAIFEAAYVYFWVEEDRSFGIHNPDYTVALLQAAIVHADGVLAIGNPGTTLYNYELSQNYPNPFNPTTKINFSLSNAGHAKMVVYNTLGQQVAVLVDMDLRAGNHEADFSGAGLSSGVYFYRLTVTTSDNNLAFQDINKMVLMK